jgi:hypothetical protein
VRVGEARTRLRPFLSNEDRVPDWALLDVARTILRAQRAGADLPLEFMGVGMTAVVYCDASGCAFKVSRRLAPDAVEFFAREAAFLEVAAHVPFVKDHVARLLAWRPDLGVIVRECVRGAHGFGYGRGKRSLHDLHETIDRLMRPYGFSAPEFKEDSYVIARGRGPVLVDAGFAHSVGRRTARHALDVAAGRVRSEEFMDSPEAQSFDVVMDAEAGRIPVPIAIRILRRLVAAAPPARRSEIERRIARLEVARANPDDWEDLPSMFVGPQAEPSFEDLPATFAPASAYLPAPVAPRRAAPSIVIRLRVPAWEQPALLETLDAIAASDPDVSALLRGAVVSSAEGAQIALPDMDAVCRVRHAVWKFAGDPSQDYRARAKALEIEKAMDAQTEGRAAACLDRMVWRLQRAAGTTAPAPVGVYVPRWKLKATQLLGTEAVVLDAEEVLEPTRLRVTFQGEFEKALDSFYAEKRWEVEDAIQESILSGCTLCARGQCQHIEEVAFEFAVACAMEVIAEQLTRAGIEAAVVADPADMQCPWKIFFRRPGIFGEYHMIHAQQVGIQLGDYGPGDWIVMPACMMNMDEETFSEIVRGDFFYSD